MADIQLPSEFYFDAPSLARVGVVRPRDILFIIVHHSAGTAASDLRWLTTQGHVSAHRYATRDGQGYQLLPDLVAAWGCAVDAAHVVLPSPLGTRWLHNENWPTLQFELENTGQQPFTPVQYDLATGWAAQWIAQYGIPVDRHHLLGHRELTTEPLHQDPNDLWDWARFMAMVRASLSAAQYQDYYIVGPPTITRARFRAVLADPPPQPHRAESRPLLRPLLRLSD